MKTLKTAEQVRQEFAARGESVVDWAMAHGVKPAAVYHLLNGFTKGGRGESHRAAVLLGLKHGIAKAKTL